MIKMMNDITNEMKFFLNSDILDEILLIIVELLLDQLSRISGIIDSDLELIELRKI
jgi:hypothetical protein